MKLITLNTWAGRLKEPFETFLKSKAGETDIFCFQEMLNDLDEEVPTSDYINHDEGNRHILKEVNELLTDFDMYFCPVVENVYGIAIFLKKGFEVVASGEVMLYENPSFDPKDELNDHNRKMQWVHIKRDRKDVIIMNVHGHWKPEGKSDNENTIEQSKIIKTFIESTGNTPKIMVGDFNLLPETESIKILEENFTNLITKYNIPTTRTELYKGDDKHADYAFVSDEILVEGFEALPDVVSDHVPLALTFDVF
jgi:endonuclease/exonuclease/phosphatase family metal-dependent hydrolase